MILKLRMEQNLNQSQSEFITYSALLAEFV